MIEILIIGLSVYLGWASGKRINKLSPQRHKRLWSLMYVVYAGYAASAIWLQVERRPGLAEQLVLLGGLAALALNTKLTQKQWEANQAPQITEKGYDPQPGAAP